MIPSEKHLLTRRRPAPSGKEQVRPVGPLLLRLCLIFILCMAALFGVAAWWSRQDARDDAATAASDLARSIAHQVARVIDVADLTLMQMRDSARSTDWDDPEQVAAVDSQLKQIRERLPYVFRLFVIDEVGRIRATSMDEIEPDITAADRDYFLAQRDADVGLFVSGRLRSKASGEPIMVLSRRVADADGRFLGIVSVSFEAREFGRFYETMQLDYEPAFRLIGPNLNILVSDPPLPDDASTTISPELSIRLARADVGSVVYTSKDGVERMWSYQKVSGYPLYVSAGFSEDAVAADWLSETLPYFLFGVVALGGVALLGFVALQRARGEDAARLQLVDANMHLEERVQQRTAALEEANDRSNRAVESLQAQSERLQAINRISASLAAELELERLVQAITDATTQLTNAKFGAFFYNIVSGPDEAYTLYTLSGAPREAFEKFPMPRNTAVFGPTFRGEGVVRSDDITKDPRYGRNAPYYGMPEGHLPVRSYLAVPVVSRSGEVIGGLFFGHEKIGVFTEDVEQIVAGIAGQAAVAIDNARLFGAAQTEIAERRRAEERLESLLAEKEEMLKEIHHRVKNNLQIILSLLSMETGKIADPDARERLATVRRRISVIARVHDQLYASENFTRIDFAEHLERMVEGLKELYEGEAKANIVIRAEELFCGLDTAIPLGLAANELITNSLKHAFPDARRGTIHVELHRARPGGPVDLVVADDGVGLGRSAAASNGGLGRTMITALVQQVSAEMSVEEDGGTRVTIRLPGDQFGD